VKKVARGVCLAATAGEARGVIGGIYQCPDYALRLHVSVLALAYCSIYP